MEDPCYAAWHSQCSQLVTRWSSKPGCRWIQDETLACNRPSVDWSLWVKIVFFSVIPETTGIIGWIFPPSNNPPMYFAPSILRTYECRLLVGGRNLIHIAYQQTVGQTRRTRNRIRPSPAWASTLSRGTPPGASRQLIEWTYTGKHSKPQCKITAIRLYLSNIWWLTICMCIFAYV